MNLQMITQTNASLTGWGAVYNGVQISGQWSEDERTLHINMLELLAIELGLFFFTRRKRVTVINFQIDNKAALPYFLKMGGGDRGGAKNENNKLIKLSKETYV